MKSHSINQSINPSIDRPNLRIWEFEKYFNQPISRWKLYSFKNQNIGRNRWNFSEISIYHIAKETGLCAPCPVRDVLLQHRPENGQRIINTVQSDQSARLQIANANVGLVLGDGKKLQTSSGIILSHKKREKVTTRSILMKKNKDIIQRYNPTELFLFNSLCFFHDFLCIKDISSYRFQSEIRGIRDALSHHGRVGGGRGLDEFFRLFVCRRCSLYVREENAYNQMIYSCIFG